MFRRKFFWMMTAFLVALCSLPLVAQTGGEGKRVSSDMQPGILEEAETEPGIHNLQSVTNEAPAASGVLSAGVRRVWPVYGAKFGLKALLQAQIENTGNLTLPPDAVVCFWVNGLNPSGPCMVGHTPVLNLHPESARWYAFVWPTPNAGPGDGYTYQVQVCAGDTALSPLSEPQVIEFVGQTIGTPQPISPFDITLNETPTFMWKSVDGASWYVLNVNVYGPRGSTIKRWYRSEDITRGNSCIGRLTGPLPKGAHTWWVQPWNVDGYGPGSERKSFNIG